MCGCVDMKPPALSLLYRSSPRPLKGRCECVEREEEEKE